MKNMKNVAFLLAACALVLTGVDLAAAETKVNVVVCNPTTEGVPSCVEDCLQQGSITLDCIEICIAPDVTLIDARTVVATIAYATCMVMGLL